MIKKDRLAYFVVGILIIPFFIIPLLNDYSNVFLRNGINIFKLKIFDPIILLHTVLRWVGASAEIAWFCLFLLWILLTLAIGYSINVILKNKRTEKE